MKKFKKIVAIILAFAFFAAGFVVENSVSKSGVIDKDKKTSLTLLAKRQVSLLRDSKTSVFTDATEFNLRSGDNIQTGPSDGIQIMFAENSSIRLYPETVVIFDYFDDKSEQYIFRLLKGRAWINNIFSSATINVIAGGTSTVSKNSVFDVRFDGKKTLIYANKHAVAVNLILPDSKETDFINYFILPQGNQTTIFTSKVIEEASTIKKLLYSKLIKEFLVGYVDALELKNDTWIQNNIQKDSELLQKISADMLQKIRDSGLKISSIRSLNYELGRVFRDLVNMLTFAPGRTNTRTADSIFDNFHDGQYLLVFGRLNEAEERLTLFGNLISEYLNANGSAHDDTLHTSLSREYNLLRFVAGNEAIYNAKNKLFKILFSELDNGENSTARPSESSVKPLLRPDGATFYKFSLLRDLINNVYDLADTDSQTSRSMLNSYFQNLISLINKERKHLNGPSERSVKPLLSTLSRGFGAATFGFKNLLAEENRLLDNLLLQYPQFYLDSVFSMKNVVEQELLGSISEETSKNDEKQTIVSYKIDLLNRLKEFFLADKVGLNEARQVIFRLFREAEDLQLPVTAEAAVNELYSKRLKDFGVFFRFLNSPEYIETTLHGVSRKEQFKQYLAAQTAQVDIGQLRREIRGNK